MQIYFEPLFDECLLMISYGESALPVFQKLTCSCWIIVAVFFFGRLTCILLILLYRSNAVELLSYNRYITICNCCLNAPKSLWIPQLTASDHRVDPHLWSNHFKVNKNPVHWTKSLLHKAAIILVVLWRLILENFLYQEGSRVTCTILNGQLFIL